MRFLDLVWNAVGNSLRSRTRTTLTVIAIFIGAFTLTLTNAVGTGINRYIDDTVASIGAENVLTVTKSAEDSAEGPVLYDPASATVTEVTPDAPEGTLRAAITSADVDELRAVEGVTSVEPVLAVDTDYIQYDGGDQFRISVGAGAAGALVQLAAGEQPQWNSTGNELTLPDSYVEPLGFSGPGDAVGKSVSLGITDAEGTPGVLEAVIVGVSEPGLVGGEAATANQALTSALYERQGAGLPDAARDVYGQAVVRFDASASEVERGELQDELTAAGYDSSTVEDQIGAFKSVIDAIILVLNGFAVIALLAAAFGIVNTLLMSVQERTREIGLMKAMGMGAGRIYGLFSLEAVFIGLLGSAIGAAAAIAAGAVVNGRLSGTLLADLPGLSLLAFDPLSILVIVAGVMGIAFLAGTIPAARAARQNPIESLRYE